MRFCLYVLLIVTISLVFVCGCKKHNDQSNSVVLSGKHVFSGSCKYYTSGLGYSFELDTTESLTAEILRPASKDSSDFILIPVTFDPRDGVYGILTVSPKYPLGVSGPNLDTGFLAIQIKDTLLTIPLQLPFDYVAYNQQYDGDGSLVNGKLTIRYHTFRRGYNKSSTLITHL